MSPQRSTFFVKIRQILKRIFVISYIFTNGNVVEILQDADAGEIGVALDDGNFYIYELSTEVLADENPGEKGLLFHVSDLGRIVDIEWKWGGSFNWAFKRYE